MRTIQGASEETGVPAHTLRAWERRYDVLTPPRTPSGYRDYDDDTLARIVAMAALVDEGVAPARAADEVRVRFGRPTFRRPLVVGDDEDLIDAAVRLDALAVGRILDDRFAVLDAETVIDAWLMPAMGRVGRAWASGRLSVAGEHLVAHAVMRRLSAAYESAGRGQGRPVIIGAPPGVQHELGLLAFGVLARRAGLATLYLGADVPLDAWWDAVSAADPVCAVTVAPRRADAPRVAQVARQIAGVPLWVGGRYQHLVKPPVRQLGHCLGDAVKLLA